MKIILEEDGSGVEINETILPNSDQNAIYFFKLFLESIATQKAQMERPDIENHDINVLGVEF